MGKRNGKPEHYQSFERILLRVIGVLVIFLSIGVWSTFSYVLNNRNLINENRDIMLKNVNLLEERRMQHTALKKEINELENEVRLVRETLNSHKKGGSNAPK